MGIQSWQLWQLCVFVKNPNRTSGIYKTGGGRAVEWRCTYTRTLATCLQNLFPTIFAPYKQYFIGERFVFLKIVLNSISVNILTLVRSFVISGFCLSKSWRAALLFPMDKLKFLKNIPLNFETSFYKYLVPDCYWITCVVLIRCTLYFFSILNVNVLLYMKDAFDIINLPTVPAHDFKHKTPLMTVGKRTSLFNSDKTVSFHLLKVTKLFTNNIR